MALTLGADLHTALALAASAAEQAAVVTALATVLADQAVRLAGSAGAADYAAFRTYFTAVRANSRCTVDTRIAVTAYLAAVSTRLTAVRADVNMVSALAAVSADFTGAVGAMLFALFTNHFTVGTVVAISAEGAAVGADLAAVGAMALVVSGTLIAKLTLLTEFIAQALGAGITFLTVWHTIARNKAGTAILAGSLIFQMAHQAGLAILVTGITAAGIKAAFTQCTEWRYGSAGTAVRAMILARTVDASLAVRAPFLKAVVALEASYAEVAGLEQTVFAVLTVGAFVIGTFMALFTFRAVLSTFGAFAALLAVITVVKLFFTALTVRAEIAAVVAFIAHFACLTPCLSTFGTGILALRADVYLAVARTADAMVSVKYGTVDAQAAGIAVADAILTKIAFATESDLITAFPTINAMCSITQCTFDAHLTIVAIFDAVRAQAAILAYREYIFAFAAATAVMVGLDAAVDTRIVVILADITAVTAYLPAFIADVKFIPAVTAVTAVLTFIKCTLVAHIAVIAPAVILAVFAQPAAGTEIIVVPATLAAVIAVVAGIRRTLKADLAVFTPAGTFVAFAALLADRYLGVALLAFAAVITA